MGPYHQQSNGGRRGGRGSSRGGGGRGGRGGGSGGGGRGGRGRADRTREVNDTTTLPTSLADELQTTGADRELDKRFEFRFNKKVLNRKAERKQLRADKKQKIHHHHSQKKESLREESRSAAANPNAKRKGAPEAATAESTLASKKQKTGAQGLLAKPVATTAAAAVLKKGKAAPIMDAAAEKRQMERLAQTNPQFYQMLADQNLVSASMMNGKPVGKSALAEDDAEIRKYAKSLKIKDKKKIPSAFTEDGLDYLFKGLIGDGGSGGEASDGDEGYEAFLAAKRAKKGAKPSSARDDDEESDGDDDDDDDDDASEDDFGGILGGEFDPAEGDDVDEFGLTGDIRLEDYESDISSSDGGEFEGQDDDDELEDDMDSDINDIDDLSQSDGDDIEGLSDSEEDDVDYMESEDSDGEEKIDGDQEQADDVLDVAAPAATFKVSETAAAKPAIAPVAGKYVPPHLRNKPANKSEQYMRLKRQVQGQLNRLSDANMESIISNIEECYRNNSRHDVTEILTDSIVSFIADHANLLDSFVMTYAAFVASLYAIVGVEFCAHLVQTVVEVFEKSRAEYLAGRAVDPEGVEAKSKRCTNVVTLLAYLYNFEVVACVLIYDIIRTAIEGLSELDVELLLRMLRICGFQLRSDDPLALKDIVLSIQNAASERAADSSTRFKFMVETIMDLKNNKRKLQKRGGGAAPGGADSSQQDRLKKFVGNLGKKRTVHNAEPLRVSLADIQSVGTKGKWWLVGSAWAGHNGAGGIDQTALVSEGIGQSALNAESQSASADLLKLARQQKMNTDVRRSIFVVLMSSEDCVDAFERLLRLNLKDKQEREIVRVLLHCCQRERVYNPYYALVANRICAHAHGFKITFQFALWDAFKAMAAAAGTGGDDDEDADAMDVRKVSHLAKLYAYLISTDGAQLGILKALTFTALSPLQTLFLKLLLSTLFTAHLASEAQVKAVVARAASQENVREGLIFFFKRWSKEEYDVGGKKVDHDIIKKGCKWAKEALTGAGSHSAKR
ncbi:suppressor of glycerol defect [Geranomyces michiganensis]|nr:suppressor of glycerol defect [Geranomyces michiganensis]